MGLPVLIEGESGSGKTYSIKGLDVDKVGVFEEQKSGEKGKKKGGKGEKKEKEKRRRKEEKKKKRK